MSRPVRAVTMPSVRGQLAARMRRDARSIGERNDPRCAAVAQLWHQQARALSSATLWWVSPDMTTLAADTGLSDDELPQWVPDVVTRTGLLVWDGGLPIRILNRSGYMPDEHVTIDAVSWAPIPAWSQHPDMQGLRIELWSRRGLTNEPCSEPLKLVTVAMGEGDERIHLGDRYVSPEYAIWRILCATMLLAHEPKAGATRPANFALDGSAKETRVRDVPDVTVVDLRTVRDWTIGPDGAERGDNRNYSHRWIVPPHTRTYHVGPGRQRTEKRWIAPYVAGPEGAPLIAKEHVWVWRR